MYIGKNEINRAINIFQAELSKEPNSYQNLLNLARAYQLNGEYDQAITQCLNIERLFPELWKSKGNHLLSSIYIEQGKYKNVIDILETELSDLNESDLNTQSDILNNLAFLSYLLGDKTAANNKLNQVLSNSVSLKNQLIAYLIKGYLLAYDNNISELSNIVQISQDSLNKHPDETFYNILNSAIKFNYYYANGDYRSATTEFDNMDDKGDFKYRYNYYAGLAYLKLGNYPKVLQLINEMRNPFLSSDVRSFIYPRSFYIEGLVHEASGNLEEANNSYQTLLNIWKNGDREAPEYQETLQRFTNLEIFNIK